MTLQTNSENTLNLQFKLFSPCPLIAIFAITLVLYNLTYIYIYIYIYDCTAFIMLLAKRLTLLKRTDQRPPTPTQWICDDLFFKLGGNPTRGSSNQFKQYSSISFNVGLNLTFSYFSFFLLNTIIIIIAIIILIVRFHCFLKPHFHLPFFFYYSYVLLLLLLLS